MSETVDPTEFHDSVIEGVDKHKTIELEDGNGRVLEGVELHIVSKNELTKAIEAMPTDVFDGIDTEDEDLTAEEAEEIARQQGGTQLNEEMYDAFERLCKESLEHPGLSKTQMELIIDEFAFQMVFELGSEILNFSMENSGKVTDFHIRS